MTRGNKRENVSCINPEIRCSIHNRFDIEVIDSNTGHVKQRAQAENIILNALWARMFSPASWFSYIAYGTGTGTPDVSRTSLFSYLGSLAAGTAVKTYNFSEKWASAKRSIVLTETMHVGSVLTEVGIAYNSGTSSLMTHAMLKDMNGNQISIVKTSTDIINIYATVFAHWSEMSNPANAEIIERSENNILNYMFGLSGPISFNSVSYTNTRETAGPQAGSDTPNAAVPVTLTAVYNAANKNAIITAARLSAASGNDITGGLISVVLGTTGSNLNLRSSDLRLRVGDSWFQKSSVIGEAIGTGTGSLSDFKTKFGFVKPDAKIYIDGVEQISGYTVDYDVPVGGNMGNYFIYMSFSESKPYFNRSFFNGPQFSSGDDIWYNPFYSWGIFKLTGYGINVKVSNDMINWIQLTGGTGYELNVPVEYQNYKYWRMNQTLYDPLNGVRAAQSTHVNNIHFDTPPPSGSVITMDYDTQTIAKDANHVFDLSVTLTFAEHVV